ncbi:MAG TPA: LysM peptidoglycan-binding domain-containing protein [Hungateiclostridium thermocellum]|jgi:cell division protein YceG involved in septum cleavage|uniref:Peptidoglycan-binding lysin domain-containing protein n=2 Tax=Acetivibrio thermocellus TaxID=1515 RepID=A3DDH8_ACET2|nr:LysM peptidoglycan-binding domain-containing protein [Acetivibrio thermocellus]ABN52007.1 Peptidoglycan-binding lysin domain-containing protein [Acetivibrio thermocellus ATCC 27405]ADU74512.1 Peptidoglycan-binding lysin domain [Acetivibrio thermocellus DSM 1313]ALX08455.1 Peptidoglycan-binding lysin domain-containing protein [Acetivibrio thermocellus AD2]ANV76204.1 Peptidoglycan-binding lysin domain-containing protein [Acetivibrio thermocellus DSM 2360]EIC05396.1 Peptidoglycan-binding lysin
MKKKYVLKNKRRFFVFVLFVLMGLTAVISRATSIYGYREPSYEAITVKRGDTLWSIAENYNKRGDIRKYIYDIMILNNLEDCEIIEGMELKVIVE